MTERRFLRHADLDPSSVRALPPNHAALLRNQTLFPSTVVVALRTAGPAACKLAPSSYVPLLAAVEEAAELLGKIEARRIAREQAEERGP